MQQIYLGDEHFLKEMQKAMDKQADLSEVPRAQRRPPAKSLQFYEEKYHDRDQLHRLMLSADGRGAAFSALLRLARRSLTSSMKWVR